MQPRVKDKLGYSWLAAKMQRYEYRYMPPMSMTSASSIHPSNSWMNTIIVCLLLIMCATLYHQWSNTLSKKSSPYTAIRNYLQNESSLANAKKPILWIHIPYEYNSRVWSSFGSRSSFQLNQPYLHITVRSILFHCEDSFTICIVDDDSFGTLLPTWTLDMNTLVEPNKQYVRTLGLAKLLHMYGGMVVPLSFLCFRDLLPLYEFGIRNNKMFVCEQVDKNITATTHAFCPSVEFMGCIRHSSTMAELIEFMQRIISRDFTAQVEFLGLFDQWTRERKQSEELNVIAGTDVGTKNVRNQPVLVDHLLAEPVIDFYVNMYGIWIPYRDILRRSALDWFTYMSIPQLVEDENPSCVLCKYLIVAFNKSGVLETKEEVKEYREQVKQDVNRWITFWRTPLSTQYGPKPLMP